MASKYDPETRAKAVRLVLEHRDDYPSEWAAITAVSKQAGDDRRDVAQAGSVSSRSTTGSAAVFRAKPRRRSARSSAATPSLSRPIVILGWVDCLGA